MLFFYKPLGDYTSEIRDFSCFRSRVVFWTFRTVKNETTTLYRNVGNRLHSKAASHPRRTSSSQKGLRGEWLMIFIQNYL